MRLGFPSQNVGEMDFSYPVAISVRNVALKRVRHMLSSVISSPCIPLLRKSSIIFESLWYWGFRFGVFSSIAMFFSQKNFHVLVIHDLVVNLVSGGN